MPGILKVPEIRNKILFTIFILLVFRLLAHVPVPGVDLASLRSYLASSSLFSIFNIFSGGGFQNFSIITLGLTPYINASIILQLFTAVIPQLEELSKEGESGRAKINQYTKLLTVPLAIIQSYGMYFLLKSQGVVSNLDPLSLLVLVFSFVGGSLLLVWIGDLVTEQGIGNGVSLLIFAGIVSRLPASVYQFISTLQASDLADLILFVVLSLLVVLGIVYVNEGIRKIPVEYGRTGRSGAYSSSYLPLKVNQAGVIPIIFAVSVVLVPSIVGPPLLALPYGFLNTIGNFLVTYFSPQAVVYNIFYFMLVFAFTYFYTTFQFDPSKIADDLKKRGGFIPGIRPGKETERYLKNVTTRIT
ncbi:preprotein translocase subunit SecY, partial [candidate division WWE3 bacterium]|nr:preprotein translocase subunit SecY [candidate division WWE3 bacterium]